MAGRIGKSIDRLDERISPFVNNSNNVDYGLDDLGIPILLPGATLPRDLDLEDTFRILAGERTIEYERKYRQMLKEGVTPTIPCPGLDTSYYDYTQAEKDYFENEQRFPKIEPLYDKDHPPPADLDKDDIQYILWCQTHNPKHPNCKCSAKF
jgi:hypothetical protein